MYHVYKKYGERLIRASLYKGFAVSQPGKSPLFFMLRPRVHVKDLIYHLIGEDAEDFALWAFGPDFKTVMPIEYLVYWNANHGHKLRLKPEGVMWEDVPLMVELWRKATIQDHHLDIA